MGRLEEARRDEKQRSLSDREYDSALFELLRQKRKELADSAGLPPYMIFPDTTLIAMSRECPQSRDRMLDMPGVGAVKLEKYAAVFLDAIRGYCREREGGSHS
jgi:ATP-dependent DNA helicase RecQ